MTRILLALLALYRRWLSPALHSLGTGGCKYLPTCSEYAAQAITAHGPLRGTGLAISRLLRCHPFSRGGLDPVPAPQGRKQSETGQTPSSAAKNHPAGPAKQTPPFAHKPLP